MLWNVPADCTRQADEGNNSAFSQLSILTGQNISFEGTKIMATIANRLEKNSWKRSEYTNYDTALTI